ncbi:hypothetical protein B0H13DRAFT_2351771 [Mycena leptocephala]|nr:hypothetical protein B0H13DRAFT_2351771 [Mycena leptocephala]
MHDAENQFSCEDVKSLEQIVQQYVDGAVERNDAIVSLTSGIVSISTTRKFSFTSRFLLLYLEQLDAHDAEQERRGEHGGGSRGDGNSDGNGRNNGGDSSPDCKRKLADRLSNPDDRDDELDEVRVQNSKVDASSFAWQSRGQIPGLPRPHRRTSERPASSGAPLTGHQETIRDLLNSLHAPALPESLWKPVRLDRFIDLDSILSNSYTVEVEERQQLVLGNIHLEIRNLKWSRGSPPTRSGLTRSESSRTLSNFAFTFATSPSTSASSTTTVLQEFSSDSAVTSSSVKSTNFAPRKFVATSTTVVESLGQSAIIATPALSATETGMSPPSTPTGHAAGPELPARPATLFESAAHPHIRWFTEMENTDDTPDAASYSCTAHYTEIDEPPPRPPVKTAKSEVRKTHFIVFNFCPGETLIKDLPAMLFAHLN